MESFNYFVIQLSFFALTVLFVGWFVFDIFSGISATAWPPERKRKIRLGIVSGLLIWMLVVGALSLSGFLQNFSSLPPRMMIVLFIPLIVILIITFSSSVKDVINNIPSRNLIRLHVFRVFVEILLWMLFLENLLPQQMSFEGRNFDVVAGLTAPLAAYFFANNKKALIVWNFFGLALLLNIVVVAVLSLPSPFRYFMNEPANTIVAYFPIVLLPAFLVPLAYTLHFFSLRQLLNKA